MQATELDSTIGGWLVAAVSEGRVNPLEVVAARQEVLRHPEWREAISERYDLLIEALTALAEL